MLSYLFCRWTLFLINYVSLVMHCLAGAMKQSRNVKKEKDTLLIIGKNMYFIQYVSERTFFFLHV